MDTHQGVYVFDTDDDEEFSTRRSVVNLKLGSVVAVPLLGQSGLIGILYVDSRNRAMPALEKELEVLTAIANVAAMAVENARLVTELRQSLDRQTATAEVLQVINRSPGDLRPVFEAMLEKAVRLCEASFGVMWQFEDGVGRTVDLATAELSAAYARDVTAGRVEMDGVQVVEVTVRAPLPVLGLLGPSGTLVVRGHAMVEGP